MRDDREIDGILVGAGPMAMDYVPVLKILNQSFIVVGRGEESARVFKEETNLDVETGGIEK